MPIITIDKYNKEEIFNYRCPPISYSWGRMTGVEVSEAMLADIKKYFCAFFYRESIKILKATLVEDEDNLMYDEVEVKLLHCGNLERRNIRLKDLYNF